MIAAHGPAHAVVGHSMGAAASALAVLDGTPTERLVLVTPLADPTHLHRRASRTPSASASRPGTGSSSAWRCSRAAGWPTSTSRCARPTRDGPLPAALILSDRDDKEADHEDGARIARAWPGAELVLSEGLGHRRILRDEETIKRIVAFASD